MSSTRLNIHDWYLARLRNQATTRSAESQKLTPMALVESDKKLIQEIVTQSSDNQSMRAQNFRKLIDAAHTQTQQLESTLMMLLAIAGILIILGSILI